MFVLVVLLVAGLIHLFLYRGLVRGLGIESPTALWTLRVVAVLLAGSYVLTRWLDGFAPFPVILGAHWVASVWLGLMFHLFWIGLVFWLAKALMWATGLWSRLEPWHAAIGRSAVGAVALAAVTLSVVGMVIARGPSRVRRVRIPVAGGGPELAKLRIVVASDFHAGVLVTADEVAKRVAEIRALEPDLILLPGDIVDFPPDRIPETADRYAALTAPLGVYATTGNHEYYVGLEASLAFFARAGFRTLVNERVDLPGGLILAGVEDHTARSFGREIPPLTEVLGPEAKSRPAILMNHTPAEKSTRAALDAGADLVVSGHTHGGQIWPFRYLSELALPMNRGLFPLDGGSQLTTVGVGWWGPPMRLGAPPEILLIELVPASPD